MAIATIQEDAASVERSRGRRAEAYSARAVLWTDSTLKRVRLCGHHSVRRSGVVAVRLSYSAGHAVAGYAGVATCGSVWACPVCARKIAAARQVELETAIGRWEALGGCVALATFTVSHQQGQALGSVWDAVSAGWNAVTGGRVWKRNARDYGIEGWARVVEVTNGAAGWHVHVHAALFLHHGLGAWARAGLTDSLLARWRRGIAKHGFTASAEHGADVRMCHGRDARRLLADYFTKGSYEPSGDAGALAALEVTRGDLKRSRGHSRTPFGILADFIASGDVADWELWAEWEAGSKGRRQMTWCRGLRDLLRLTAERTDDEIAAEEMGSAVDDVVLLPRETWNVLRWRGFLLLDVLETGGVVAGRAWLDTHGLAWHWPG